MGLLAYLLVGALSGHPEAVTEPDGQPKEQVRLALAETYMQRVAESMIEDQPIGGWQVDARPGNEIELKGQITAEAFGREIGLPVSFRLGISVASGEVSLVLLEAKLPGGVDAAEAGAALSPLLAQVSRSFQEEIAAAVGPGWSLAEVTTTEEELVLVLDRRLGP